MIDLQPETIRCVIGSWIRHDWEINGVPVTRVVEPVNGPVLIEHPAVNNGYPTTLYDIFRVLWTKQAMPYNNRCVPVDRDFYRYAPDNDSRAHEWEIVSRLELHNEWLAQQGRWRGRPCSFIRFRFEVLTDWKRNFWIGSITIRDVAKAAGVSEPAAARFIHGETLWYI